MLAFTKHGNVVFTVPEKIFFGKLEMPRISLCQFFEFTYPERQRVMAL